MLTDAYCLTIVFITLIDGRLKLCSTRTLQDRHNRVSARLYYEKPFKHACKVSSLFFFLAITVSALFVHYRGKINGSADIMAAFHSQKRLGGVFITTLPFKNILWSNHISSTTPHVVSMSYTTYRV